MDNGTLVKLERKYNEALNRNPFDLDKASIYNNLYYEALFNLHQRSNEEERIELYIELEKLCEQGLIIKIIQVGFNNRKV